jgi:predicted RNA binding protein YcfA (HicA-like mRNA interferase family)
MPRKLRQLIADLEQVGWVVVSGGKGSHRKFAHPRTGRKIILSGQPGADALYYQEKQVKQGLREVRDES